MFSNRSIIFFVKTIFLSTCCIVISTQLLFSQEEHINHVELKWRTIETEHFYIHFHNGAERSGRVAAKVAEEIFGPVTSLYNHVPDQKVSIIMKDYDDYSNGAAYFYDNKIELWAPSLDFDLRGAHNWLRNVITHEFTHIIQIQTSMKYGRRVPGFYVQWLNYEDERRQDVLYGYPNTVVSYPVSGFVVPSWFAEGVAQYNRPEASYDTWDSHRDMILRMYALDGNMLSWNEMSVFGKTSLGNESSYNAGFSLAKYISETYGQDAIPRIAKNLSRLDAWTIDAAIERALGKNGQALYQEWKETMTTRYKEKTATIKTNIVEGRKYFFDGKDSLATGIGFANLNPVFSPDGKRFAYTSNKQTDYFGTSALFVGNFETKNEKQIIGGVRSSISWSPDGKKLYYTKHSHKNPNWSNLSDIYVYDVESEKETRLTFGKRAISASLSSNGSQLVFTSESDGTLNIAVVDSIGNNFRQLTAFRNGEQTYHPKWSPDGKTIVFGFSVNDGQDIARVSSDSGAVEFLVTGDDDARDPVFEIDGSAIIFSSDRTGIYNLYRMELSTGTISQLTNVVGGAFMATVSCNGAIIYSGYTSEGFKLRMLDEPRPADFSTSSYQYVRPSPKNDIDTSLPRNKFDWKQLRAFDDTQYSTAEEKNYKNIFTSLSIIPFLRIDNYNTKSSGLDVLKPGLYFISSDVLDKYSIFGGAAMNKSFERDLFFIFDYRDRIVGLYQLGLAPTISFEMYNITRKRLHEELVIVKDLEISHADVTFALIEFDLYFKQHLLSENDVLSLGYSHSRYSTDISSFLVEKSALLVPASSELYFKGNDISVQWKWKGIAPSRTMEVNPVGISLFVRYDYEMNRFNSTGDYDRTETGLTPHLTPFNFHKAEFKVTQHFQLPLWKHTLSFSLRGGTIFGPQVPDFFDFYAGGLVGMKGFPFYAISGNEVATLNIAYRFPLWENIDVRVMQLHFDKLYGEVHGDYGNAWNGDPNIRDFKKDAGFELRLEAFSYYAYPTRFFFNGTYGLDQFTISKQNKNYTYGKEWRFYFGILFGFDFSNDVVQRFKGVYQ